MASQAKFEKFSQKDGGGDSSNEKGKMFIGGLSWETTHDNLLRHFSRYGEVVDCVVMKNPETGRSRGFGFITFQDPNNVDLVLQNTPHILDSRTIDPKPCNPRAGMVRTTRRNLNGYKVFLGGLPSNLTETDLRNFFSQYGKVTEVVIMYDQEKKKSRGFGFLTFESEESVDRCCSEHYVNINGKQVEIKKAEPRDTRGGGMGRGHSGGWDGPGMGMHGGMGPMGGPMGPMGGGMMGGYQGWGGPGNQGGYGYGPQGGYQGWGPQGQWGGYGPQGGYAGPQGNGGPQGGAPNGGPQGGYGNWNWNGPGGPQGGPQGGPAGPGGPQGEMYSRGGPNSSGGGTGGSSSSGPGGAPGPKATQETSQYGSGGSNGGYNGNGNGYGGSYGVEGNQGYRGGYSQDGSSQGYGAGPGYGNPEGVPPPSGVGSSGAGQGGPGVGIGAGSSGPGGPGPQRGGSYNQPSQSQGYHPYRRGV